MRALAPSAAIAAAAAVVLAALATRVGDWAVMTDELLYERVAIALAEPGLPRLHGRLVGVFPLAYPILLAPVFAIVRQPDAVVVAHALNGVLFASAAIPCYLLARGLGLPPLVRSCAAIFAVVLPWTVIGGFVMTEAAAYPATLWAIFAIQRAAHAPSDRSYALALLGLAVAALARTQLIVLAAALAAAAVAVEVRERRGWRAHRVLIGASALAAVAFAALAATGRLGTALGSYAATIEEGSLLSRGVFRNALVHLDVLGIAIGLVPLLVGGGWALEALVRRPPRRELHAFAAIVVTASALLALQVASFVERFAGGEVKDRYLFYLAPLLFLATAAAFADPAPRPAGLLAMTTLFVLTVGWEDFAPIPGIHLDSPASAVHDPLYRALGDPASWLAVAAGAVAVAFVLAFRAPRVRERLALLTLGGVTLLCAVETGYAWDRLLGSIGPSARPIAQAPPVELAWVDDALPSDADAGLIAYSLSDEWFASAIAWWDVEFWNSRVKHAYVVDGRFSYTPETFPLEPLEVDYDTGVITGSVAPYVVRSTLDARFGFVGDRVAERAEMEIVRLRAPVRAAWATRGLDADGWTRPGRPAQLRVYGDGMIAVGLSLGVSMLDRPRGYDLGGANVGYLASTETRQLQFAVCAVGGHADVPIRILGSSRVRGIALPPPARQGLREVGVHLADISATPTGQTCT